MFGPVYDKVSTAPEAVSQSSKNSLIYTDWEQQNWLWRVITLQVANANVLANTLLFTNPADTEQH